MYPEQPTEDPNRMSEQEYRGLSMVTGGWGQEELDFLEKLNTSEDLPPIAKTNLFGLFDRSIRNTNYGVHEIKAERARCNELLAWIRYNLPPGRYTPELGTLFRNVKMVHNAILSGAYQGFNRKQFNTRFAHVTTERNQPELPKQGLRQKLLGF